MEEFKLDKRKWNKVLLGELAEEISEREDNPAESVYERFVGLEHFVTGEMKIKQWATTENLVSSAKVFQSGDVLFARRNAYLRRASMVEFDGLCSGDAFVLRENHKKIVPGFLAFILNSDQLWDYANANAAGTMSKRVKWRDLANYEFLLPPKDQQATLAELLWAGDEVLDEHENLAIKIDQAERSYRNEVFDNSFNLIPTKIGRMAEVKRGKFSHRPRNEPKFYGGNIPFIQTSDVVNAEFGKIKTYSQTLNELGLTVSKLFPSGTIVMTIAANIGDVAELTFDSAFPDSLVGLIPDENVVDKGYFLFLLGHNKKVFEQNATKGAQMNLNNEILKGIELGIHPKNDQREIAGKLNTFLQSKKSLTQHLVSSRQIQKQLINQIFSE